MPQTCTVCKHPQRRKIDQLLLKQKPIRDIAERFALSKTSLGKHAERHIAADLAAAKQRAHADAGERLAALLEEIEHDTRVIKNLNMPRHDPEGRDIQLVWTRPGDPEPDQPPPPAIADPDPRVALAALDRLTRIAALRARIAENDQAPDDEQPPKAIGFAPPSPPPTIEPDEASKPEASKPARTPPANRPHKKAG